MDKLNAMRAFVAVVEAGGFSEAARRLDVSKTMISKQVGQLEDDLGARLLQRTTRRVSVTSAGQAYFEQCKPLLAEFDELDAAMRSEQAEPSGLLRVAAPISFTELRLMGIVSEFARRHPQISLDFQLTDRFVDLIEERVDVAIRIGKLPESSLVARRIGETALVMCAAPDYLAAHGEPVRAEELAGHDCVVDSNYPGDTRWVLGEGAGSVTVVVEPAIRVNSAPAARELVLAGHGIAYLPSFAVADDIAAGRLRALLTQHPSLPLGIYAVYPHRKHLSAKVRLFIDTLVEFLGV